MGGAKALKIAVFFAEVVKRGEPVVRRAVGQVDHKVGRVRVDVCRVRGFGRRHWAGSFNGAWCRSAFDLRRNWQPLCRIVARQVSAGTDCFRKTPEGRSGRGQGSGVNVVGAFVSVHGFEVDHVAHDREAVGDAIAAVHVAGVAGDGERLAAVVALDEGNHLGRGAGLPPSGDRR